MIKPVPTAVLRSIRNAWIAGIVSAVLGSLIIVGSMVNPGSSKLQLDAFGFIDVALSLGLSYGVYRKSRTCAILLFALFAINKLSMWSQLGTASGWPIALVFFWLYGKGIEGTFRYHKLQEQVSSVPAA